MPNNPGPSKGHGPPGCGSGPGKVFLVFKDRERQPLWRLPFLIPEGRRRPSSNLLKILKLNEVCINWERLFTNPRFAFNDPVLHTIQRPRQLRRPRLIPQPSGPKAWYSPYGLMPRAGKGISTTSLAIPPALPWIGRSDQGKNTPPPHPPSLTRGFIAPEGSPVIPLCHLLLGKCLSLGITAGSFPVFVMNFHTICSFPPINQNRPHSIQVENKALIFKYS